VDGFSKPNVHHRLPGGGHEVVIDFYYETIFAVVSASFLNPSNTVGGYGKPPFLHTGENIHDTSLG
jgi:hypothetical protein